MRVQSSSSSGEEIVELDADGPDESTTLLSGSYGSGSIRFATIAKSYVSWDTLKSSIIVVLTIVAAVVFTTVHEEKNQIEHLAAVSAAYPIIHDVNAANYSVGITARLLKKNETWSSIQSWNGTIKPESELTARHTFDLGSVDAYSDLRLMLSTTSDTPIGTTLTANWIWWLARYEVIFAAIILAVLYVLIIFELVHRTIAAMFAAFLGLGLVSQMHARPTFEMVVSFIDYETVGLLFGMMIMVGIFSTTGVFEWGAVKVYKLSKGNLWHMTIVMCMATAVISAFLDNVTTILLFAPVTIKICKVLDVPPTKILLAEVMFSNVGGTATIIGDPPNIIIGNHPHIKKFVDFANFSLHVAPVIILLLIILFFYFQFFFSNDIHRDPKLHLETDIVIWERTLAKFTHSDASPSETKVADQLKAHIKQLRQDLQTKDEKVATVEELEKKYKIKEPALLINSSIVLVCVMSLFFSHSFLHVNLTLAWIAIIGAMVHIIVSGIRNVDEILEKVEFGTLMFFASLFVLMRCLEELGLIEWIGIQTTALIGQVPAGKGREAVAILLILWVSSIVSAFIDNIPYTATMVPVVVQLAEADLGLHLTPLVWALSLGTCLGGNGSLIGASANVVAVGLAEQQGHEIGFLEFLKMGFPIMILTIFVSSIYMLVFHVWIPWY